MLTRSRYEFILKAYTYFIENVKIVTLVIVHEVDLTNTDIDKLQLYANLGVPEFWHYNGRLWNIYKLECNSYQEVEVSPTFPFVEKTKLYELITQASVDEIAAEQTLRKWIKTQL